MIPALSFEPLSPVAFLDRSAAVFPERTAVIDGHRRFTYVEFHDRCRRLAGVLAALANGRPVAVLAPNTHVMLEAPGLTVDPAVLAALCAYSLSGYKRPTSYVVVEAIPKNAVGKIDKVAVRAAHAAASAAA